jgi:SNF2 family DNA or RNA helicase
LSDLLVQLSAGLESLVFTGPAMAELRARLGAAHVATRRAGTGAISVRGSHAAAALSVAREIGGVRADPLVERYAHNRVLAFARHPALLERVRELQSGGLAVAQSRLGDIDLRRLDAHQVVNVAAITAPEAYGLCLFDEQGAGKTVSAIFGWDTLVQRRQVDRLLVVCPKAMVAEWERDLARFTGGLYAVQQVTGTVTRKRRQLRAAADVYVTNFETAVSLDRELLSLVRNGDRRTMLVVDESFLVKNPEAMRSRALRVVREWCDRCLVLCGTPAPNAARDLVGQFDLADLGVCFSGIDVPEDRDEALPIIQQAINDRGAYLRNLKRDVLPDLPRRRFTVVPVELAPRQRAAYTAAASSLAHDLEAIDDHGFRSQLASFAARRSALLQLCSNPAGVLDGYAEEPAKLLALDRLVGELVAAGEKAIVWSFYTASIDAACRRLVRHGVRRYDGTVSDTAVRREAVRAFQEDPEVHVMVANPAAAGAGLTLTAARYAIYESFSNQAAHFLQSLDRIHRRGQTRDVEYVVLLADGTLEEAEYERLQAKERASQDLLGDVVDPPLTRQVLLNELGITQEAA